jgi:trigger factor
MKTSIEDISSVKKKLLVEIDAQEVDKKVNASFKALGKKAKIRGFRPGKIPRRILERYFGEQVLEDVKSQLVKETLTKALEETKAFPLAMPAVESETLKVGENFKYSAIMEVKPEFELKDYMGLEIEKEICSVGDGDVDRQLQEIRKGHGNLVSIGEDRGVAENDHVIIEYEAFEGDSALEGMKSQNFLVRVGSGEFHPDFEKALIGLKKEDAAEIKVDFEEDYYYPKLAGKRVTFRVKVTDVKEMELPEFSDEFAESLGIGVNNLDELREKIKENLVAGEDRRIDRDLKRRLLKKVSDGVEFEVPEILVQSEINYGIQNIKQNLVRTGSSMERAGFEEQKLREELRPASEVRVKELLMLGEIARQNDLTISEMELSGGFEKMALNTGHNPGELRQYYESNNLMDLFRQRLLEEKVLNYLVESAKIKQVKKDEISVNED